MQDFSKIITSLIKLTRKGEKCVWTDECASAFEKLNKLITTLILKTPTWTGGMVIYSDASRKDLGCILMHMDML